MSYATVSSLWSLLTIGAICIAIKLAPDLGVSGMAKLIGGTILAGYLHSLYTASCESRRRGEVLNQYTPDRDTGSEDDLL